MAKNYAPSWVTLGTYSGKLYGMVFKGANKSTIWYSVAGLQERRRDAAEDVDRAAHGRQDAARLGRAGVLARRGGRLDADRPVREHLPARRPARRSTTSWPTTRSSGPTRRSRPRSSRWPRSSATPTTSSAAPTGALQADFPTSVTNVFSLPAKAAMVIEGDFVPGAATKSKAKPIVELQPVRVPVRERLGARRSSAVATPS